MKLSDVSHGPKWILWLMIPILAVISIVLISGHGSSLIAGYNTSSKEEKAKYDEKKLCRTIGIGLGVVTILVLFMALFEDILPAYFACIAIVIIIADAVVMAVVSNTRCRKR